MSKSIHFIGQPMFGQIVDLLDQKEILKFSKEIGGERYVKKFNAWQHLIVMLYATIERFDSLREITSAMDGNPDKFAHVGLTVRPRRSTLSDANARRSDKVFEYTYRTLYDRYKDELSSDSRKRQTPAWLKNLQIIDSTTISLFTNLLYKGVGRHPKSGKKKGGLKVHTIINANEGVPSDIRFTSAATHDSFMLIPEHYHDGDILAMDRAYIDYSKMEELTRRNVTYVTKMKKNLVYEVLTDGMFITPDGLMEFRVQNVLFTKKGKDGEEIKHKARIVTYVDTKEGKSKLIPLLTNDTDMDPLEIVDIYRKRWEIELLFKQLKQNFPLRYFYGQSANAIKIQIWVSLIANLLLMVIQKRIKRTWSFSGLATIVRIMLMCYVNCYSYLECPEMDWIKKIEWEKNKIDSEPTFF